MTITGRVGLFFAALLGCAAVLTVLVIDRNTAEFRQKHQALAEQSVRITIDEINVLLNEIRRATGLFISHNSELLWKLSHNPGDEATYQKIDEMLDEHFPEHFSFTVTNSRGQLLYDDFGEKIGQLCIRNIRDNFEDEHKHSIVVHPGPREYHIDIMVPWSYNGQKQGVFFKSYKLDHLARILKVSQPADHSLMIVKTTDPDLIEISALGGRDIIEQSRSIRLSDSEKANIIFSQPIEGTEWTMIGIIDPNAEAIYRTRFMRPIIAAWVVLLLLTLVALYTIRKEERKRSDAEHALQLSHDELETRVEEQTEHLRIFEKAANQADEIFFITDTDGLICYVNSKFERCTGYSKEEAIGQKPSILKSEAMEAGFYRELWETILNHESFNAIFTNRCKNGDLIYMDQTITPLEDNSGNIQRFISTSRDITSDKHNQEKLKYLSERDLLTGFYNFGHFEEIVSGRIAANETTSRHFALFYIHIVGYDQLYQTLGQIICDSVIIELAKRLKLLARESDILCRHGRSNFLMYVGEVSNDDEGCPSAERILRTFRKPMVIQSQDVSISTHIGIAIHPEDDNSFDGLIKRSYAAVNRSAGSPGDAYVFYKKGMSEIALERMHLEKQLRNALDKGEINFYYQPKIDIHTGELKGFEALARWTRQDDLQIIPPTAFIPVLEEIGEIGNLCYLAINEACSLLNELNIEGPIDFNVAINLSADQFKDHRIVDYIKNALVKYELAAHHLEFEVTESIMIHDVDEVVEILNAIHAIGCHISMDDFGTGYSSMQYLKTLPVDIVKIDQSFIKSIDVNPDDQTFAKSIIDMASNIGKRTVAEGVENSAQLQLLREMQCDMVQGYYVSRPIPADQLDDWIRQYDRNEYMARETDENLETIDA